MMMLLSVILSAIPAHSARIKIHAYTTLQGECPRAKYEHSYDPEVEEEDRKCTYEYTYTGCADGWFTGVVVPHLGDGTYRVDSECAHVVDPTDNQVALQPPFTAKHAHTWGPIRGGPLKTAEHSMPTLNHLLYNQGVADAALEARRTAAKEKADRIKSSQDEFRALRATEEATLGGAPLPNASAGGAPIQVNGQLALNQLLRRWALATTKDLMDMNFVWLHILDEGACMTAFNAGAVHKGCYYRRRGDVGDTYITIDTRRVAHRETRRLNANQTGNGRFANTICWEYVNWNQIEDPDLIDVVRLSAAERGDFQAWCTLPENNYDLTNVAALF